jgi:hypothetical protein
MISQPQTAARQRLAVRPSRRLLAGLTLGLLLGCGDGRPERLQVSGQVLIDGAPLTHGYIRFVPRGARPSGSELDEQGRFTLSCYGDEDGVVPGVHRIEVDGAELISSRERKWHAPKKYVRFKTSGLEQEITESTDSLTINLTWDGGKPFVERVR